MEINILYYIILFIFLAFSSLEVLGKETPDQKNYSKEIKADYKTPQVIPPKKEVTKASL